MANRILHAHCASGDLDRGRPHLLGAVAAVGDQAGERACSTSYWRFVQLASVFPFLVTGCSWSFKRGSQALLRVAPWGMIPLSKKRHSAIASRRATATMAMRLPLLFAAGPCVRAANHCAIALCGW